MQSSKQKTSWQEWLKIGRLIPLATVLVALVIGALTLLNRFQATLAEGIIISLLALLATDALVERISFLEKIESKISAWPGPSQLKNRSNLVSIEEMALGATEIAAVGPTLVSLVTPNYDFYVQKMREGCRLRFLLLNPNSLAAQVWSQGQRISTTTQDSDSSLKTLDVLMQLKGVKGKCEVRLSNNLLPFSLVMTNPSNDSGRMNVEILAYKTSLSNRPHIHLTKRESEKWFTFFATQFETLWSESMKREV